MTQIEIEGGYVARLDDSDSDLVRKYQWVMARRGSAESPIFYALARKTANLFMHQLIMGRKWIDHRDGDGLNNQRDNLRFATHAQNMANRKKSVQCTSRFKGVSWIARRGYWAVKVKKNGVAIRCHAADEVDAAQIYNFLAEEIHGEFARLNTPIDNYPSRENRQ